MLYDSDTQGHDAHLEEVVVDVLRRTVTLKMSAYPAPEASDRVPIDIIFSDVAEFHTSADVEELAKHHFAGHLSYWKIAEADGTSHFYLAAGHISITARSAPALIYR